MRVFIFIFIAFLFTPSAHAAKVDMPLPTCVQSLVKTPLEPVGHGRFRKFAMTIYNATLFAPGGVYDPNKPYALQLTYARDLDKGTIVDVITDDIAEQEVADKITQKEWADTINGIIPDIKDGESLTGLYLPGKPAPLFHNCTMIGHTDDPALTKAFFNIWLGPKADEDMRTGLTNAKN